jgi:tRNA G18 (ribose-2'-O)-methylase SpoU
MDPPPRRLLERRGGLVAGALQRGAPMCFACAMPIVRVDDLGDTRLEGYRSLKDATLAARHGRFVVEGRGNLRVLLERSNYRPESILLSERAWAAMEEELAATPPGCPIFVAAQTILDGIAGFPIHRGCLALCLRRPTPDPLWLAREALALEATPRLVVLEGLTNHDNVGGVFRNAMALGARGVILCPRSCDPLYRKAIRTSMGGTLCVPFARALVWPEPLRELRDLGFELLALDPDEANSDIATLDPDRLGPVALLFGTEGPGLGAEALALSDRRLRIGMQPGVDSLNVSVASGIALHHLRGGTV